ncbi:hypothetical protein T4B_8004 [Trichinella pseudospiralis]|uniref:Uncharacterized protein n=1 Tax=Trichinella pseudospiralis TaxID=6337 RepID=A0A0V1H1K7_TRIPS|nr:hypothetical protein T4B_8004 [Trichinella pseudospiralis]
MLYRNIVYLKIKRFQIVHAEKSLCCFPFPSVLIRRRKPKRLYFLVGQFSKHYQTVKKCQPSQLAYY